MRSRMFCSGIAALLLVAVGGCTCNPGPDQPQPGATLGEAPKSKEELTAAWKKLAQITKQEEMNMVEASNIAQQLANFGAGSLTPLVDVLADPNSSPVAKVLVVVSLTPVANEDALRGEARRILALTEPGNDATARACATQLLWHYKGEDYEKALQKLIQDPERRVKLAALTVLAERGDDNALNQLVLMWGEPVTTVAEKSQIATTISSQALNPKRVSILAEAAAEKRLHADVRAQAIMVVSVVGSEKEMKTLEACLADDEDANVKKAAQQAIEAIKARLAGGGGSPISITTSPAPTDGAAPAQPQQPAETVVAEGEQTQQMKISF